MYKFFGNFSKIKSVVGSRVILFIFLNKHFDRFLRIFQGQLKAK